MATEGSFAGARLLVVDDEPNFLDLLSTSLRFAGFTVTAASSGEQALHAAAREQPDLVVLDIMLPDMDGLSVARRLRTAIGPARRGGYLPIVFLTARDSTQDKIDGLTTGGDDYVTKPFSFEELIARIRAVLRRTSGLFEDTTLRVADLELDPDGHEVRRAGQIIELSPTEFKLLRFLMQNAGRVLSKLQIVNNVWEYDFGGDVSIVESYVSYLRRKVDRVEPTLIHTVRGVGYVLRERR